MSIIDHWSGWQARPVGGDTGAASHGRYRFADATVDVVDLTDVPQAAWAGLADQALEANAFYLPQWARAVADHAEGMSGARALLAWDTPARERLIGMLPVVSAWRALRIPIPVFVAWQAYAPVVTPLIDRDRAAAAAHGLLLAAKQAGAMALLLPSVVDDGPALTVLRAAAASLGGASRAFDRRQRARLDATQDGETALAALGSKKLKELRRQRNRLADGGAVAFKTAGPGEETAAALEAFLSLEASGWKGAKGTALACKSGDARFIKAALSELAPTGAAEVAVLSSGENVVAAGILLRHLRRGYFFKIGYDEAAGRVSPGVQLTLELTRQLCADAGIDDVDSTAVSGHPMIDHVWRARLPVSGWLVPTAPSGLALAVCAALIGLRRFARSAARVVFQRIGLSKGT